jgi:hypothetical protein
MTFGDVQNPRKCKWADAASLAFIESHFKLPISALLRATFDVGYFPPNTPPALTRRIAAANSAKLPVLLLR